MLRFLKSDLDGACSDAKFSDQFFIDLMFSPVDSSGRKKGNEISSGSDLSRRPLPLSLSVEETKRNVGVSGDMDSNHVISRSEEGSGVQLISMPTEEIKDAEIEAERVDGDALLWDAVAAKISKSKKKKSRKYFLHQKDHFSITDELGRSRSADSTDGGHMAPIGTVPFLHFFFFYFMPPISSFFLSFFHLLSLSLIIVYTMIRSSLTILISLRALFLCLFFTFKCHRFRMKN